jgi:transposase
MTLHARDLINIPAETVEVAQATFLKGNVYMTMRDRINLWYKDSDYADLFKSNEGRVAESPGRLNLVMVMQYAEGLSDQQAAEAVRSRIDWKYALGLPLRDPGFHYSILSEHRQRLLSGEAEARLLEDMLQQMQAAKLLRARGCQRTDATHVLAAVRHLNRLERVGETLRHALNQIAKVAPEWLLEQVNPDWFELYGARFEQYRLPKNKGQRQALAQQIGQDGYHLLAVLEADDTPSALANLAAVQTLGQVWGQQFKLEAGQVQWRSSEQQPPLEEKIESPYDPEARYSKKRDTRWVGYKVHLTESCDDDSPHLISHVETVCAPSHDGQALDTIHTQLAQKGLLPREHLVDAAYVDATALVCSQQVHQLELIGPAPKDPSWQARDPQAYDVAYFTIDWAQQQVICPQGNSSVLWRPKQDRHGNPVIDVHFASANCNACPARSRCTQAKQGPRQLTLKPQAQHCALQAARQYQTTDDFKERYKKRAGIEGTISQATRSFHLRQSRFIGLAKTHLHHLLIACAINLSRAVFWLLERPRSLTRISPFAALAPC